MNESLIDVRKAYSDMNWLKFCKMYSRKYNKPFEKVLKSYMETFPAVVMTKDTPFLEKQAKERILRS